MDLSESLPEDHDKMVKKSQPVKRGKKYIPPTTENFKRSKKGFQLMVQELRKALEDQAKRMPSKSLLNTDKTKVAYKHQSQKGTIDMQTLLKKAPLFLDAFFVGTRKRTEFAIKVRGWYQTIFKGIEEYKTEPLHEMVALISMFQPAALRTYAPDDDAEDEEDAQDEDDAEEGEDSEN